MFGGPFIPPSMPPLPTTAFIPPPPPGVPSVHYGPHSSIPNYNSNNVGPGHCAAENTYKRLLQEALKSPDVPFDYAPPRKEST